VQARRFAVNLSARFDELACQATLCFLIGSGVFRLQECLTAFRHARSIIRIRMISRGDRRYTVDADASLPD
jgi:hypothetical protein